MKTGAWSIESCAAPRIPVRDAWSRALLPITGCARAAHHADGLSYDRIAAGGNPSLVRVPDLDTRWLGAPLGGQCQPSSRAPKKRVEARWHLTCVENSRARAKASLERPGIGAAAGAKYLESKGTQLWLRLGKPNWSPGLHTNPERVSKKAENW